MGWVWAAGAAWLLLGAGAAVLIGRSIVLADRKAADRAANAANVVVDRPPLTLLPSPPDASAGEATSEPADPTASAGPGSAREAPTVPGLPVARPPVGRPSVPRSKRHHPPRRSSSG